MSETQYDIIDVRCDHLSCEDKKTGYRMTGRCANCGTEPLIGLFTSGHEARGGTLSRAACPACGCHILHQSKAACPACGCHTLHWSKLAGPDDVTRREVQP